MRDNGFDYSVSAFIKDCNTEKLIALLDYGIVTCNLAIDKNRFLDSFLSIADLSYDSHYDPIVSFKYNDGVITGMSFYVSALKDKSLMFSYLESVKQNLSLKTLSRISELITECVHLRFSDIFLISWDFETNVQEQNKIYLKIKDIPNFICKIKPDFPYLLDFINVEGFRFCELAFVIKDAKLKMFNLYFKPI